MRRPTTVLAALALAAAVAGCGDDDDARSAPPVEIDMRNLRFSPDRVRVEEGRTVRWVNRESIQHTVVAQEGADFESSLLDKRDTFEHRTEDPGTIRYVCTLHPGMEGTITVVD